LIKQDKPFHGFLTGKPVKVEPHLQPYRSVFASYAREDAAEVLKRIQGARAWDPALDIFIDVEGLRQNDNWRQKLKQRIDQSDVLWLFWCTHAKGSHFVNVEWRYASWKKGLDFVRPVPLERSKHAPPPPRLAQKHFDDPIIDHILASADGTRTHT
jgi:hypothetical protein